MPAPNAVGLYTRIMAAMWDENLFIRVPKLFQSLFGRPGTGAQTIYSPDQNLIEIDLVSATRKLAQLVQRGAESFPTDLPMEFTGRFANEMSRYPLIHQAGVVNASQLTDRLPGENPFQGLSKMQRLQVLAQKIHRNQAMSAGRTMEYLAAQSVITGFMPSLIGTADANLQYDWARSAGNLITVETAWDISEAVPMDDLDTACVAVDQNGHLNPDYCVMGRDALAAFLRDAEVQALADNRRYTFVAAGRNGVIIPSELQFLVDNGALPIGQITLLTGYNLWIFGYNQTYVDANDNVVYYMPVDKALVGSSQARFDRYYGPSEFLPPEITTSNLIERMGINNAIVSFPENDRQGDVIDLNAFYFNASVEKRVFNIETQTAPIFATTHTDAVATLSGLTTPSET